ncbi:MAG: TIM barrel protein [Oscillospiraceae bacterium]|nr:TIM barrel protein [Oscillospiraceae bacterium]
MPIVFAPGGKADSFGRRKFPIELPAYLAEFGLNGFEFECGRGVNISEEAYEFFAVDRGIKLSLHAPYFISISSVEEATRIKSIQYILQSAEAACKLGADRIIVHSGSCAKISRDVALGYALETLKKARQVMDENGFYDIMICPETMGKINQLGTVTEVVELCKLDERMLPCVDFGHVYARNSGSVDYAGVFDEIADKLGNERLRKIHIHFSKIEFTTGGEKRHLTFENRQFGPEYEPLIDEIVRRNLEPFIVCESDGTQSEDASQMLKYYRGILL